MDRNFLEKLEFHTVFSALCRSYAGLWAEIFLIKLEFPAVFSALYRSYAGLWTEIFLRNLNFTQFSLPYAALMPAYGQILL